MRTEREAVGLVDVQLTVGGRAEQLHAAKAAGRSSASRACNIVASVCCWLGGVTGEMDGADSPSALEVEEVRGEGLAA